MDADKEKKIKKKAELKELTKPFVEEYLNEEYQEVVDKLIEKMSRKRDVPFLTGRIEIWASAVIHAVGSINFLFDKSSKPYVTLEEICNFFGTKQSTVTQKSKTIRDMFNMTYFDSEFSTQTMEESSPFNKMMEVDGFIVPKDMFKRDK